MFRSSWRKLARPHLPKRDETTAPDSHLRYLMHLRIPIAFQPRGVAFLCQHGSSGGVPSSGRLRLLSMKERCQFPPPGEPDARVTETFLWSARIFHQFPHTPFHTHTHTTLHYTILCWNTGMQKGPGNQHMD